MIDYPPNNEALITAFKRYIQHPHSKQAQDKVEKMLENKPETNLYVAILNRKRYQDRSAFLFYPPHGATPQGQELADLLQSLGYKFNYDPELDDELYAIYLNKPVESVNVS